MIWILAVSVGIVVGLVVGSLANVGQRRRKSRATGTIIVSKDDGKTVYRLELDGDVDEIFSEANEVLFRVTR